MQKEKEVRKAGGRGGGGTVLPLDRVLCAIGLLEFNGTETRAFDFYNYQFVIRRTPGVR